MYQPRWYLEEAIDATFDYWQSVGGVDPATGGPVPADPVVALPTGTGKSHLLSQTVGRTIQMFPNTRWIVGTHVKELVEQNAERFCEQWPNISVGIHAASMKRRDTENQVIFGSIQSMRKTPELFGHRDLFAIDEAHLVSPNVDASYGAFTNGLRIKNPWQRNFGTTATPYRQGLGMLTNGPMFTDVAYNLCTIDGFARLFADGYLCPPIGKKTVAEIDTSKLRLAGGEFTEASADEAIDEICFEALKEAVSYGWERRSWIVFVPSIKRAETVAKMLREFFGVPAAAVHSKSDSMYGEGTRERNIAAFKAGALRCLVNVDTLTTGFDHPPIDLIVMLRPTTSTGLWVQMVGRGTRPFPGKLNCLVLDFAGNTRRLGPINDPVLPGPRGAKKGDAPVKICKACGVYNHSSARYCDGCGTDFPPGEGNGSGIEGTASDADILASDLPQVEYFDVLRVQYEVHRSFRNGGESLKVAYYCAGLRTFFEYLKFEGAKPFAIHKAHDWLRQRTPDADWAINELKNGNHEGVAHHFIFEGTPTFRKPSRISVWVNTPNPQVQAYEF